MRKITRVLDGLTRAMAVISGICITSMMVLICTDILSRIVRGASLWGVIEITELLVAVVFFVSITYTQWTNNHINMDLLAGRLSNKKGLIVGAINWTIVAGLLVIFAWTTWDYAIDAFIAREYRFGYVYFYTYPGKLIAAVTLTLLFIVVFRQAISYYAQLMRHIRHGSRIHEASQ